jgi:RsmE family RNA methyltransferase
MNSDSVIHYHPTLPRSPHHICKRALKDARQQRLIAKNSNAVITTPPQYPAPSFMNLLLLLPEDHLENGLYRIAGRRFTHIQTFLEPVQGNTLRAGLLNGPLGSATIERLGETSLIVNFQATHQPPAPTDIILLLALPRPKMLKRILADIATLGVKQIILLNSYKVEKSYWKTPELHADLLQEKLLLGLEQAGDTQLPTLQLEPRFKPFVEDQLPGLVANRRCLLAHPGNHPPLPCALNESLALAIGPEGGWTDYECQQLMAAGFQRHSFGSRILRVETAIPALTGRLLAFPDTSGAS